MPPPRSLIPHLLTHQPVLQLPRPVLLPHQPVPLLPRHTLLPVRRLHTRRPRISPQLPLHLPLIPYYGLRHLPPPRTLLPAKPPNTLPSGLLQPRPLNTLPSRLLQPRLHHTLLHPGLSYTLLHPGLLHRRLLHT